MSYDFFLALGDSSNFDSNLIRRYLTKIALAYSLLIVAGLVETF